jgi:hypothetical protein
MFLFSQAIEAAKATGVQVWTWTKGRGSGQRCQAATDSPGTAFLSATFEHESCARVKRFLACPSRIHKIMPRWESGTTCGSASAIDRNRGGLERQNSPAVAPAVALTTLRALAGHYSNVGTQPVSSSDLPPSRTAYGPGTPSESCRSTCGWRIHKSDDNGRLAPANPTVLLLAIRSLIGKRRSSRIWQDEVTMLYLGTPPGCQRNSGTQRSRPAAANDRGLYQVSTAH